MKFLIMEFTAVFKGVVKGAIVRPSSILIQCDRMDEKCGAW
jgi:hypothetical protein